MGVDLCVDAGNCGRESLALLSLDGEARWRPPVHPNLSSEGIHVGLDLCSGLVFLLLQIALHEAGFWVSLAGPCLFFLQETVEFDLLLPPPPPPPPPPPHCHRRPLVEGDALACPRPCLSLRLRVDDPVVTKTLLRQSSAKEQGKGREEQKEVSSLLLHNLHAQLRHSLTALNAGVKTRTRATSASSSLRRRARSTQPSSRYCCPLLSPPLPHHAVWDAPQNFPST
ncbi:hypothetical protein BC830DRAFT_554960 [Chytriomyces sp. MP71]|nr:hypothetical protein BC830DRAFT_554960 [Chytriomyces sp. MP71]